MPESKRIVESDYTKALRLFTCIACRCRPATDVHHPTIDRFRMARRNDDEVGVPLCRKCHTQLHEGVGGERGFWNRLGLSVYYVCEVLRGIWRDHRDGFVEKAENEMRILWLEGQQRVARNMFVYKEKSA